MLQQQPGVPVAAGGVRGKREGDHDGGGKDRMGLNVQSIARQREVNRAKGRGVSCQIGFDPRAKRDGLVPTVGSRIDILVRTNFLRSSDVLEPPRRTG
jgi:hypothetical protein